MSGISRDEWLAAVGLAEHQNDPAALTVAEIAVLLGLSERQAYNRTIALVKAKRAVQTMKFITTRAGQRRRVSAYRLVKAGKK